MPPECSFLDQYKVIQGYFLEHTCYKTNLPHFILDLLNDSYRKCLNSTESNKFVISLNFVLYCRDSSANLNRLRTAASSVNETNLNSHLFTFRVQSRGSFIQKQDVRLSDKGTSYGNALFLATRELSSFVPYSGVVFL